MYVVISGASVGAATLTPLDDNGQPDPDEPAVSLEGDDLVEAVEAFELENPRWVWVDTAARYGWLLAHGVRVDRCHDLRLTRAILRSSALSAGTRLAASPRSDWDAAPPLTTLGGSGDGSGSGSAASINGAVPFDFDAVVSAPEGARAAGSASASPGGGAGSGTNVGVTDSASADDELLAARTVAELSLQLDAIRSSTEPNRLRLLIAAESAGALVAAEMSHAGLPWREDVHDQLLTELLGPQVPAGQRPARLEALARAVQQALDAPQLNPDSPQDLLRALRGAGLAVTTTRSWELRAIDHPVIRPLLEYKKLSRLLTANGWSWMATWVRDGRFHPDYMPGGVVSGRWATRGGGALQLPKQVRRAVTADDGWTLVVADAAQLEPRILAGIAADTVMATAGRGKDLYNGIVESGAVETRAQAKVAMLGAMYGATTGESGRLLPRLGRAFPTALAYVENAARAGERGEVVTSRLGRSAPRPGETWWETQALAREGTPDERTQQQARREARDWGRFTRNFVVQASAADWALCWLADLRRRLAALAPDPLDADVPLDGALLLKVASVAEPVADQPESGTPDVADFVDKTAAHVDADEPGDALSPVEREAARIAAIEAEIAERERRKAADSPFRAADPVAAMAARLAELQSAGRSVRAVPPSASTTAAPVAHSASPAHPAGAAHPATTAHSASSAGPAHPLIPEPASTSGFSARGEADGAAAPDVDAGRAAEPFARAPHLVFFLHDEVIVHAPAALADDVAEAIRASAAAATRLLFGQFPLDVPLDISIVDSYADAD